MPSRAMHFENHSLVKLTGNHFDFLSRLVRQQSRWGKNNSIFKHLAGKKQANTATTRLEQQTQTYYSPAINYVDT